MTARLTVNQVIARSIKAHGYKYDYSLVEYKNKDEKIKIICPIHGVFEQLAKDHMYIRSDRKKAHGCPKCSASTIENDIINYLDSKGISYLFEHRFSDCVDARKLPFDFYIKEYNLCIECDGEHHSLPMLYGKNRNDGIQYTSGDEYLKYTKKHDTIKTKYCEDNNIKLLRISYNSFDKFEQILQEQLK